MSKKKQTVELSEIEKSAVGEICDLMTASLAKLFSEKLGDDVGMSPSVVDVAKFESLATAVPVPVLLIQLSCSSGLDGQLFLFINGEGLPAVFDLAIPESAKDIGADDDVILENLKEIIGSAISEAMSNFAESMGQTIDCSVIDTLILQDESGLESISFMYPDGNLLLASAELTLPAAGANAGYLIPTELGRQIIDMLLGDVQAADTVAPVQDTPEDLVDDDIEVVAGDEAVTESKATVEGVVHLDEADIPPIFDDDDVFIQETVPHVRDLQPAAFDVLGADLGGGGSNNISLLLDVVLDASIELGKTKMTISDILRLGRGSVIELDKLASEPVEFLVNSKVIARGEVVVIDDNFGIRITEIMSPKDMLEQL
ncbi:MAG: flagellar motor switch protein FliN [Candidatus Aquicultor primus]|uniref:Flagellar motor switch protein FliN n=1 Tax=Candidatus Aquicultor primus TaxID=1797195 RepID=A0A1F2UKV7_9ACTN|nr:MAG: flagellar motor switch protein FliN [Candidatus Aquicultor primus]HCG99068.1 flagellar motor switch protein FliN [Actinomycetota bacterium]